MRDIFSGVSAILFGGIGICRLVGSVLERGFWRVREQGRITWSWPRNTVWQYERGYRWFLTDRHTQLDQSHNIAVQLTRRSARHLAAGPTRYGY